MPLSTKDYQRLRWASRRGMRELDLLLLPFAEHCFPTLADADQQRFIRLLECEDNDLFAWLLGHQSPQDVELALIVQQVINYARSSER